MAQTTHANPSTPSDEKLTARQVVDRLMGQLAPERFEPTNDTFKAGDPNTVVTGVATTFIASIDVLRRASEAGLNLIITHEPTFYQGEDDTSQLEGDAVLQFKRDLLEQLGLVVWRFHDHWHAHRPDGIYEGMMDALGWRDDQIPGSPFYQLPEISVRELARTLKRKLGAGAVRVVGDPELRSGKVGLSVGAPYAISQMRMLQKDEVEILVAGEGREWETCEYVRDAAAAGKRKAVIFLGHCNSEEAGMDHLARVLQPMFPNLPVRFLPAGDPFWSV